MVFPSLFKTGSLHHFSYGIRTTRVFKPRMLMNSQKVEKYHSLSFRPRIKCGVNCSRARSASVQAGRRNPKRYPVISDS
jgi:hypothetical protein